MPSDYYTPKKTRNLYKPSDPKPFKLSRSKIDLFLECPRCFFLDRKLGVGRPPGFPFSLNAAVDHLLKKEFDAHRAKGIAHPMMARYQIDAIPFGHPKLDSWRDTFTGVQRLHELTNFLVFGAVDDVWVNSARELHVVDYKATAKDSEVNLDAEWQDGYKRQMEVYQWLLRGNDFQVSDVGYFVYVNGKRDAKAFDGKLEFDVSVIPYKGSDVWIEKALVEAKKTLDENAIPSVGTRCDYCPYREAVGMSFRELTEKARNEHGQHALF